MRDTESVVISVSDAGKTWRVTDPETEPFAWLTLEETLTPYDLDPDVILR